MDLPPIMQKGHPLPASMGRTADLYHDIREMRIAAQKEVDEIKAREAEIREYLISNLAKGDDTGAAGLKYRAQITTKTKPRLEDWGVFCAWVRKNDRFDMIQHRLSDKAVMDFNTEENRTVPGTDVIHVPDVSITKI